MPWIWQSPLWPAFGYDAKATELALANATGAIGEISGLHQGLGAGERKELHLRQIVQEALGSFGIEGVPLNPAQIEASIVASLRHRDRNAFNRRSDAIAALMLRAREDTTHLTAEMLFDWHRLLFFGMEVEDIGRWRRSGIEIVRSAIAGRHDVLFIAPPPERVEAEMTRFLEWLRDDRPMAPAVKAALAHLWFETIHPFSDGNGRIGRAVIEHVFARSGALPFSLSRQIEMEKRAYYAALQAGRQEGTDAIDATPFVLWFLECLTRAAAAAKDEARFLLARNRYFIRFDLSPRAETVLRRIFDQGPKRVADGITARTYAKIAGVSGPTATRDLGAIAAMGALIRSEAGGRSTAYLLALD